MTLPGALLQKWDELSRAIGALQCAQPANMTAASLRLDVAKEDFVAALNEAAFIRQDAQVRAWLHEEDPTRVISASQKEQAERDGGGSASSVRPYSIALS